MWNSFRRFKSASRPSSVSKGYYRQGVQVTYPDLDRGFRFAILPAFDPGLPDDPCGFVPAMEEGPDGRRETLWYAMIMAARFVGHGNNRNKTSILSPRTFNESLQDPYAAFFDYCSRSEDWSYLTDSRGEDMEGKYRGAALPPQKTLMVANIVALQDPSAGARVAEFSMQVAEALLEDDPKAPGLLFARDAGGRYLMDDITNPEAAQVFMAARPKGKKSGCVLTAEVDDGGERVCAAMPAAALPQRARLGDLPSFMVEATPQDVADQLVKKFAGYENKAGIDETHAIDEAMKAAGIDVKVAVSSRPGSVNSAGWPCMRPKRDGIGESNSALLEKLRLSKRDESAPISQTSKPSQPSQFGRAEKMGKAESRANPALAAITVEATVTTPEKAEKAEKAEKSEKKAVLSIPGEDITTEDLSLLRDMLKGASR